MAKSDNLKLTITVDGNQVYFGAPVFYTMKTDGDGDTAIIQTEIGNTTKQRIEIQIKNHTYVEPESTSTTQSESTEAT